MARAFHAEDEIRATRELRHLAPIGHFKYVRPAKYLTNVLVERDYDQSAESGNRPDRSKEREYQRKQPGGDPQN